MSPFFFCSLQLTQSFFFCSQLRLDSEFREAALLSLLLATQRGCGDCRSDGDGYINRLSSHIIASDAFPISCQV